MCRITRTTRKGYPSKYIQKQSPATCKQLKRRTTSSLKLNTIQTVFIRIDLNSAIQQEEQWVRIFLLMAKYAEKKKQTKTSPKNSETNKSTSCSQTTLKRNNHRTSTTSFNEQETSHKQQSMDDKHDRKRTSSKRSFERIDGVRNH